MHILCLLASPLYAQQNFFNVPSSDITPKQKVFAQQQFNFSSSAIQSSTTVCIGLGKNTEMGFNVLGVTYQNQFLSHLDAPYSPLYVLNGQKRLHLNDEFALGLGGQIGVNERGQGASYVYSNAVFQHEETGTKIIAGIYRSSDGFFGPETRNFSNDDAMKQLGFQLGFEQNCWNNRLLFQADFISGKHSLGEFVIGGAYYLQKNIVISSGLQIPTFQSQSVPAIVFELTFVPSGN